MYRSSSLGEDTWINRVGLKVPWYHLEIFTLSSCCLHGRRKTRFSAIWSVRRWTATGWAGGRSGNTDSRSLATRCRPDAGRRTRTGLWTTPVCGQRAFLRCKRFEPRGPRKCAEAKTLIFPYCALYSTTKLIFGALFLDENKSFPWSARGGR